MATGDSTSSVSKFSGFPGGDSLWAFSLEIYERPGVAPACLRLQDRRGTDVNLLLHALWCGARGHLISPEEHQRTCSAVAAWHKNVVRPLRHARRWMKENRAHATQAGAALRNGIKQHELEAERLEQGLLEAVLAPPVAPAPSPTAAVDNLLGVVPEPSRSDCDDLGALLAVFWPETGSTELKARLRLL